MGRGLLLLAGVLAVAVPRAGAAEVRLDREFLAGIVDKVPPAPFAKEGQYRGAARSFRLVGIDPKGRRLLVGCEVVGEFRPPVQAALRKAAKADGPDRGGWTSFAFDVTAAVRVEPAPDGTPRFAVDVDEVKRRDLEGVAGVLAKMLGRSFDGLVTQVADGKAALLGAKVNAEVQKKLGAFREFGVLRAIDYTANDVVLTFDVTRMRREGVLGYVYPADAKDGSTPGAVPFYRWTHAKRRVHFYTTEANPPALAAAGFVCDGVACRVPASPVPGAVPLLRWRGKREWLYTTDAAGSGLARLGYRPEAVACLVFPPDADPPAGTVPLYRFVDPKSGLHFFTTHPHAEFVK